MLPAALALAGPALRPPDPFDPGPNPLLMRHPTVSRAAIVFAFAGDLWSVPRAGGDATRLTSAPGTESDPFFSPDGSMVAFSGQYDGNTDVFVVPARGGVPKRLTAHPTADTVVGWTPDGKSVIFSSTMVSPTDYPRLFTVPVTGGVPKALPFPAGVEASMSPDGKRIAYVPNGKWQQAWKRYRGGQAAPIWVADLGTSKWKAIPRGDEDDKCPMWIGDAVYYVSDPKGIMGLYRYDLGTGKTSEAVAPSGFDIKSATAGPGCIVYEKLGSLWLYDLEGRTSTRVPVEVRGDFPEVRPELKTLRASEVSISPSGQRAVAVARGLVWTVPASKGDARMLSGKVGVDRHDAVWSPDGRTIAYVTDESGAQELALYDVATDKERRVALGAPPSVYRDLVWSPDGKRIAYTDVRLNLWTMDAASGTSTKIDTDEYVVRSRIAPAWSPDSKWLAYRKVGENMLGSILLAEVATGRIVRVTDGLADAMSPVFDRSGKYLYFAASTDIGIGADVEDIAQISHLRGTSNVYAVVLKKGGPNPLQPESDEERPAPPPSADGVPVGEGGGRRRGAGAPPAAAAPTVVDAEGIEGRIVTLPLPAADYSELVPGPSESMFALGGGALTRFSLADRQTTSFASGVSHAELSADGTKLLLASGETYRIVPVGSPVGVVGAGGGRGRRPGGPAPTPVPAAPEPGGAGNTLDLSGLRAKIDPREEWRRMYHAVWRNEKLLFYAPNLHGVDADAMDRRYAPFVDNIASRDDLNYLFTDMLGELSVGHMWARGGDVPQAAPRVPGGLLGCDFEIVGGHYRLTRVYNGERWNPGLYAPLAQPGVEAKAGEYLLKIDGRPLDDAMDLYEALEGKAGKQVKVELGPTPDGVGAREAIVVPVADEHSLRFRAWSEDNRRLVDKMTGGKVGYAHIPDTGGGGWTEFNRYYYAQHGKSGIIIDDRFNHGGYVADFLVREMVKPVVYGTATRYGKVATIPSSGVYGPKVMLTNEMAGSGGDILPDLFRMHDAGKLVGKRTWGAMISANTFRLVDGGTINAPDDALYDKETGAWPIEGYGTKPDISVELDPFLWRQGHDAQLDAAVAEILRELPGAKPALGKPPVYPDKTKVRAK